MIKSLSIDHIPCFGAKASPLQPMSQITLIYGPNGSGKSSIARTLHEHHNPSFQHELFNKNFVDRLLQVDQQMPGVFVIRDGPPEIQKRIDALIGTKGSDKLSPKTGEIQNLEKLVEKYEKSIAEKEAVKGAADKKVLETCWKKRLQLPDLLQQAFDGYKNDKKKHIAEVHRIRTTTINDSLKTKDELLEEYTALEQEKANPSKPLPLLPKFSELSDFEVALLKREVKSKDATTFGEFVDQLQNSDWVREGQEFLKDSEGKCPFCQQTLPAGLANSLASLFDHHYEDQLLQLQKVRNSEQESLQTLISYLESLSEYDTSEIKELERFIKELIQTVKSRVLQIENKLKSPSRGIELEAIGKTIGEIDKLVSDTNKRIDEKNELLKNKNQVREILKSEVWRYYVHSVVDKDIAFYIGQIENPTKALNTLRAKHDKAKNNLSKIRAELSELQQKLTSSLTTVENMNKTLHSLGFLSFKLEHSKDDTYRIIRQDGSLANLTLSEGERTLISFLYFFHRIKQIHEDRTKDDGVVVIIDDPVSSLDGEMLFVLNLLIRNLFDQCSKETGRIRQIILLTHNAYFYKEADFTPTGMKSGKRSYFVLSKGADGITNHKHYEKSPIESSYKQLWHQVKASINSDELGYSASLPNAMRRIIENYFKITGGVDVDKIISEIDVEDQWASNALLAWYNDGSHTAPWDVDYASISSDASSYIRAFKQIFEKSGHIAHYEMMMADESPSPD